MDVIQCIVLRAQLHLPTTNRTMGNPAKLQDGVLSTVKVIADALQGSQLGDGRVFAVFQTA